MAQYNIESLDQNHVISVGWSELLQTYWANVKTFGENIEEIVLLSLQTQQPQALGIALVEGGYSEAIPSETLFSLWSDRDGVAF